MLPVATYKPDTLDLDNTIFTQAVSFILDTDQNMFLTGKAGTGKTTFLKYIREHTTKPMAVIAPTGVAAINAGGETIHSFLQLPLGPFVPGTIGGFGRQDDNINDKHSLVANLKLRDSKLKLLRKLKLLVVDEVSMVRADVIDAMDMVLRFARKNWLQPFGGVQMLFIGDLFQLPPVALPEEWDILGRYYASPYFFDAHVLRGQSLLYLELKKVYRQKEQTFINILNRIRNGRVLPEDIDALNTRHEPTADKDGYIMLATHNHIADAVNRQELERLPGKLYSFEGKVVNDFNTRNLPTEQTLQLKVGAQVMFIKNDLQTPRRYYNGKIGKVFSIVDDAIFISFEGEPNNLKLELETWKSIQYSLNTSTSKVEERETGSFIQYPIRLAWAVTIHKSQGLTLEKAIVDVNRSFAPGQVYVALSRCTTLEGLVLRSPLHADNIMVDERVMQFAENEADEEELTNLLEKGKKEAEAAKLAAAFSLHELVTHVAGLRSELTKRRTGPYEENLALQQQLLTILEEAEAHARKFRSQLVSLAGDEAKLKERCAAAGTYFSKQVIDKCRQMVQKHIKVVANYQKVAKQLKTWKELDDLLAKALPGFEKFVG